MLLRFALLVGLAVAPALPAQAQDVSKYSSETMLKLIAIFDRDPLSERGDAARRVVMEFAEKSDTVLVTISEGAMPWVADESVPEATRLLLTAAYVAGNVKSQLERKVNANDTLAGWQQTFRTYEALKKHARGARVKPVEQLLEDEKAGKLKERAMAVDSEGKDSV